MQPELKTQQVQWVEDVDGQLVNLDRCHRIEIGDSFIEAEDRKGVFAYYLVGNAEDKFQIYHDTEERCKSFMRNLWASLR